MNNQEHSMKNILACILTVFTICTAPPLRAECERPTNNSIGQIGAYLTGNDYLVGPELAQTAYVGGMLDGLYIGILAGSADNADACTLKAERCLSGKPVGQIKSIFDKYLRDNPAMWHTQSNILFFNAVMAKCYAR
jgi:hypothetical protein